MDQQVAQSKLMRLPEVLERFPIGKSTWWKGVADGRFPAPIKCGRISLWRETDILNLITELEGANENAASGC